MRDRKFHMMMQNPQSITFHYVFSFSSAYSALGLPCASQLANFHQAQFQLPNMFTIIHLTGPGIGGQAAHMPSSNVLSKLRRAKGTTSVMPALGCERSNGGDFVVEVVCEGILEGIHDGNKLDAIKRRGRGKVDQLQSQLSAANFVYTVLLVCLVPYALLFQDVIDFREQLCFLIIMMTFDKPIPAETVSDEGSIVFDSDMGRLKIDAIKASKDGIVK
ncbi:hypothetical protein KCU81_g145, partial [Aureobasidium melanogenum]